MSYILGWNVSIPKNSCTTFRQLLICPSPYSFPPAQHSPTLQLRWTPEVALPTAGMDQMTDMPVFPPLNCILHHMQTTISVSLKSRDLGSSMNTFWF